MRIAESAVAPRDRALFEDLIERPELVDELPRTKLAAVISHAAALQAKAAAVQSRIAARLLNEPEKPMSEQDDRLIRVDEAAKRLDYRVQYLYQLIRERRFPAHREGRKIRIAVGDLNAWIHEHSQKPVDAGRYLTYSSRHDGKRAEIDPEVLGSYPGRLRGPRRRRPELDRPSGAWGDGDSGSAGSPGSANGKTDDS